MEENEYNVKDLFQGLYHFAKAKGDPLEAIMTSKMVERGISEGDASSAARRCSNQMWRDGMKYGTAAALTMSVIGFAPVVVGATAAAMAIAGAHKALTTSEECSIFDVNLFSTVKKINDFEEDLF